MDGWISGSGRIDEWMEGWLDRYDSLNFTGLHFEPKVVGEHNVDAVINADGWVPEWET